MTNTSTLELLRLSCRGGLLVLFCCRCRMLSGTPVTPRLGCIATAVSTFPVAVTSQCPAGRCPLGSPDPVHSRRFVAVQSVKGHLSIADSISAAEACLHTVRT